MELLETELLLPSGLHLAHSFDLVAVIGSALCRLR